MEIGQRIVYAQDLEPFALRTFRTFRSLRTFRALYQTEVEVQTCLQISGDGNLRLQRCMSCGRYGSAERVPGIDKILQLLKDPVEIHLVKVGIREIGIESHKFTSYSSNSACHSDTLPSYSMVP